MTSQISQCVYTAFVFLVMLICSFGCKSHTPVKQENLQVQATISPDGQVIAIIQNQNTDRVRVRFKRLNGKHDWEDLPVPPYTTSIYFGLMGHQLLLTYPAITNKSISDLVKWDLDAYQKIKIEPTHIYSDAGLAYPIEVAPNEYLVRACSLTSENRCAKYSSIWNLIYKGERVYKYTNERRTNYGTPNIVLGRGFFWREWKGFEDKNNAHPSIRSIAFPNKIAPTFDTNQLTMQTQNIKCDYSLTRCLHSYITNPITKGEAFIFDTEIFLGELRCTIPGVTGWSDDQAITPDGNAAVMAVSTSSDKPRHVVVIQFKPKQCKPVSVEHINF